MIEHISSKLWGDYMKSIKMHPRYIPIFIEMSGVDLMYLLKKVGNFLKELWINDESTNEFGFRSQ